MTAALRERAYLVDRGLATVASLALTLEKPLLRGGEAGVGRTELAQVRADVPGAGPAGPVRGVTLVVVGLVRVGLKELGESSVLSFRINLSIIWF